MKSGNLKTTPTGFEPARAEPIGVQVRLLNHSDTVPDVGTLDASGDPDSMSIDKNRLRMRKEGTPGFEPGTC